MKKITYKKSARYKSIHVFHFKQTKIMYGNRSQNIGTMGAGSQKEHRRTFWDDGYIIYLNPD